MSLEDAQSIDHDDDRDRLASLADCMTKRESFPRSGARPPENAPVLQVRTGMVKMGQYRANACDTLNNR